MNEIETNEILIEELKTIGSLLKNLRLNHGYSLRSFCKKFGFDGMTLSRIERGKLQPDKNDYRFGLWKSNE